jgi:hypothetical protein
MKLWAWSLVMVCAAATVGCGEEGKDDKGKGGSSYSFSATSGTRIGGSGLGLRDESTKEHLAYRLNGPASLCIDQPNFFCVAPSSLTGKYLSVGLLIQANGSGMQTYFHSDAFSSITGASEAFDFDAKAPVTHSGEIKCCGGTGDLTGENVYFSDVTYLFGYLDATFKIPYSTEQQGTVSAAMKGDHTVRFVMADNIVSSYKRGDLLYKDSDGTFKWMDQSGNLSATRPASPITMDTNVVNYTSPFPELANVAVPIFYSGLSEKVLTSEEKLKETGKTYAFSFDSSSLVVITKGKDMLSLMQTVKDLMSALHLQGMPHTSLTLGQAGTSVLTVQ